MGLPESLAGKWVADNEMPPETNIWGRRYWARGNIEGEYKGRWPTPDGLKPQGLYWFFTPDQCRP